MKRKLTILLGIALALVLFMNACQTGSPADDGASTGKGPMTTVTDPETGETIGEAPGLNLNVTQEEAEEGWLAHGDIGFKYQLPKAWVERLDYLDPYAEGDPSDAKADLYKCLYYDFMETALIECAQEIINDATLTNEEKYEKMSKDVWSNAIKIFGVQLFRREAFNKAESLEKLTKFPHNRVLQWEGTSSISFHGRMKKRAIICPRRIGQFLPNSSSRSMNSSRVLRLLSPYHLCNHLTRSGTGRSTLSILTVNPSINRFSLRQS